MSLKWPIAKLSECATFQEGYVNPSQTVAAYFGDEIKWLRAVDLNDGYVFETSRRLSKAGFESAGKSALLFEPNTLAISKSGTIGRLGILRDRMCGNRAVINVKVDEGKCNTRFIFYILLTNRPTIENLAIGSVQKNLYTSALGKLEFHLPPKPTQDEIAHILGTLDDKIELNRRMNETLEAIARAIFKSWFVDFDPVRAKASGETPESICRRLRLTPDLLALFPDRLVNSELGEIPDGWELKRVDDFMELAYGKALKASDRIDGSVPVYGSGGITGFHNGHLVDGPGIIIGRKGTVGSLYWEDRPFYPIDTVFYVVPKIQLTYCYYVLQTLGLERMNTDAAVPGLNRNNVYRLPVVLSPHELRQEFDRLVKPLRDHMFANNQELTTLADIRDTLLPKLLSGELRVPIAGAA